MKLQSGKRTSAIDRNRIWQAESVPHMREEMRERILNESATWKAVKKERGQRCVEQGTECTSAQVVEDSDDDIVVGEVIRAAPMKTQKSVYSKTKGRKGEIPPREAAATRLRG